jgi:hypothetical protein
MKTAKYPPPLQGWIETFQDKEGKVVANAFVDKNIGVSCTTETHVMRCADGKHEARVGFSLMGSTNMDEAQFKRCLHNPFHPEFHDNFARGFGDTDDEAIKALEKELIKIGDSLWAEF